MFHAALAVQHRHIGIDAKVCIIGIFVFARDQHKTSIWQPRCTLAETVEGPDGNAGPVVVALAHDLGFGGIARAEGPDLFAPEIGQIDFGVRCARARRAVTIESLGRDGGFRDQVCAKGDGAFVRVGVAVELERIKAL